MRGLKCLPCETSVLDPINGIRFRGYSISDVRQLLPKAAGGEEPLPEGIFWLLVTGEVPSAEQVRALSAEWARRSELPDHVVGMLRHFPRDLHPMSQLSCALTALQLNSRFAREVAKGLHRSKYWEPAYEDVMDMLAKLPAIVASIYRISLKGGKVEEKIKEDYDWSRNLTNMMGYGNIPEFAELMRLYLTIHSDHEGGNVSAHTVHLVASALSDPYISLAAGINGLAGPLHGLANQQVLIYIKQMMKDISEHPTDDQVKEYLKKTLSSGQVIPGYGHAVLRKTDPRYLAQREFGQKHLPKDPTFKIVNQLYNIVPGMLTELGKVQNPFPNVDANSGVLLQYYGVTEMQFYTVLFGMSRAMGTMASLIWSRAMGLPIERPKSFSTDDFEKMSGGH